MSEAKLDQRELEKIVAKGESVKDVIKLAGFKAIWEEWEKVLNIAESVLQDPFLSKDEADMRVAQITYARIVEWMRVPEKIIEKGHAAKEQIRIESDDDKSSEGRPTKGNIPLIGRM